MVMHVHAQRPTNPSMDDNNQVLAARDNARFAQIHTTCVTFPFCNHIPAPPPVLPNPADFVARNTIAQVGGSFACLVALLALFHLCWFSDNARASKRAAHHVGVAFVAALRGGLRGRAPPCSAVQTSQSKEGRKEGRKRVISLWA